MIPLFLGLTIANLVGLLTALTLGYITPAREAAAQWHILAGALAAMMCCAVHCVVFTYFIATSKWIQHAIAVKGIAPELSLPTRSFKAQAFPAALAAMAMVFLTAVMGAIVDNYHISPQWHHLTALTMICINIFSAVVEYGAIVRNGDLIDQVIKAMNDAAEKSGPTTPLHS